LTVARLRPEVYLGIRMSWSKKSESTFAF